jgi:hypothetical protein
VKPYFRIAAFLLVLGIGALVLLQSWEVSQAEKGTPRPQRRPLPDITLPAKNEAPPEKQYSIGPPPEEIEELYNSVATFYGRVLDLDGLPIANATVSYAKPPNPLHNTDSTAGLEAYMKTDANGNFAIVRYKAPSLHIGVGADGYYATPESVKDFTFAPLPPSVRDHPPPGLEVPIIHQADPANPVIFKLRKMGPTVPLYELSTTVKLGPQVMVSLDQIPSVTVKGQHSITIRGKLNKQSVVIDSDTGRELYDWSVDVSVPGGGLLEREEEETLEAPLVGYRPSVRIEQMAQSGAKSWRRDVKREYFVRFGDETYARVTISCHTGMRGASNVGIRSYYDPSGGRNFEFDKAKALRLKMD